MHSRSTWTLVMVALGLFAFIFFFERHRNLLPIPPGPLLPELNLAAVSGIQLRPGGKSAEPFQVVRTNETWQMTQPIVYPVEVNRVRGLLQALNGLTRQRQVDGEALRTHTNAQEEFGFQSPQFGLTIEQIDRPTIKLEIGNATRAGDEVYLRLVGFPGIYLAESQLLQVLPQSKNDWRDRALFPWPDLKIDRIVVTNVTRVMALGVTNSSWWMTNPFTARADSARIDLRLRDLLELRITEFFSDDPALDLGPYGLRPATLDLALSQGTNPPILLSVGNSPSNDISQVYVRRNDVNGLLLVPRAPLEYWTQKQENYRDRRLVNLSEDAVDVVEMKGDGEFTIARASNQVWRITAPESLPADAALVRAYLAAINRLLIRNFVQEFHAEGDSKKYGFEPPVRTILISRSDTNASESKRMVAQLDFGEIPGNVEMVNVRRRESPNQRLEDTPIYQVPRKSFLDLPTGGWQLRDRLIWSFTTNQVSKITIRHDGKVNVVVRDGNGGWTLGPGTVGTLNNFNKLGVDFALDRLGRLNACTVDSIGRRGDYIWLERGPGALLSNSFTEKTLALELEMRGELAGQTLKVSVRPNPGDMYPLGAVTMENQDSVFVFPLDAYLLIQDSLDPARSRL